MCNVKSALAFQRRTQKSLAASHRERDDARRRCYVRRYFLNEGRLPVTREKEEDGGRGGGAGGGEGREATINISKSLFANAASEISGFAFNRAAS